MPYTVVVSERAAREIEAAAAWWARERSVEQATRWYDGIRGAIASLAVNPERCSLAAENGNFPYELRALHFGLGSRATHRIVFTILPQTVSILAIRHVAQDDLQPGDF